MDVIRKYFSLFLEKEDCEFSETETTAYEMTAAMSVLNILLENGYDKSELSGMCANWDFFTCILNNSCI